ncbi:putative rRNA-processing protein EBP2 [Orchesella cincta]|uniref:Putative rRNA-processing protein EBP2 n=1 Tax=Orchesella cincta TaxID=48709 RepID=A0A1D2MNI5_ORCCI|nr:putative rRNA-processing protein EBP2 [Orchesella cincta]
MMEDDEAFQSSSDEEMGLDSDEELQAAFARGDLKPGLVVIQKPGTQPKEKKPIVINNVPVMELKLQKMKLPKKLGWVERLDIVNGLAPLAPEIALQVDEHKSKREREIKFINVQRSKKKSLAPSQPALRSVDDDPVHNDFIREMNFYRQAQEAILKCLPRLAELGVPTKRPDDYFAEMAKSDNHMQKVAKVLNKKQIASERAEKVRKVREQKKYAKQTQVHVLQERQKAKKELNESVKKYRKGQKNALDFLDDKKGKGGGGKQNAGKGDKPRVNRRRMVKNEKYGSVAGNKKGSKWNTRESLDNFDGGSGGGKKGRAGMGRGKPGMGRGKPGMGNKRPGGGNRPGKATRQKNKARK